MKEKRNNMSQNSHEMTRQTSRVFRIAAILSPREIILNAGRDADIRKHERFAIVDNINLPILDPETGRVLGHLPVYKYQLEVINVYPRYAVLSSLTTEIGRDLMFKSRIEKMDGRENMNIANPNEVIANHRQYSESPIKVGDQLVPLMDQPF